MNRRLRRALAKAGGNAADALLWWSEREDSMYGRRSKGVGPATVSIQKRRYGRRRRERTFNRRGA